MTPERVALRVRPAGSPRGAPGEVALAEPLLASEPLVVLGAERVPPLVTAGVRPDRRTCFGPRGAALLGRDGPLWICDTGHHRLLGFRSRPAEDRAPADFVIGQPDFESEGRNAKGPVTPTSLNVPTGICAFGERGLAVADAWNHRVLIWRTSPSHHAAPPDIVLGQRDFTSGEPNGGRDAPSASGFHWPYGVACAGERLFVADSKNRRVLVWNTLPVEHGQPADLVLGQRAFDRSDENAGAAPDATSMRWPHGICFLRGHLCVSDAGNNRVMIFRGNPQESGEPAAFVLGQPNVGLVDHNQSSYWPRADTLNMPYAVAAAGDRLVVADTGSSRLLGFHIDDLATGARARALAGQFDFQSKGDNRWQAPSADSFCWPYGLEAREGLLLVADSGNNRVSLWELAA